MQSNWVGDRLDLDITAMGQKVAAQIDVEETKVPCRVMLPGMLGFFAGPIEAALRRRATCSSKKDKGSLCARLPSIPKERQLMRHFAVVGSGPAGFYTAEALAKAYGDKARIDILDRYAVPYGLIRFGVAPTTSR